MAKKKEVQQYDDQSIEKLEGADRVRKRPGVIFGSDGIEGCEHSFFEILSNSVDEAREGYGNVITVTAYKDHSIEVDDRGRGVPMGYNEKYKCYNWELIYCELYAGGKYNNNQGGGAYEFSLGLNGLGACATQYSSEFFEVFSFNGETESHMSFKKGYPVGELEVRPLEKKERRTGTVTYWRPDLEVFTSISIPREFFCEVLEKQAVVNAGLKFILKYENQDGSFFEEEFLYPNGISDYVARLAGDTAITQPVLWKMGETVGRDREDKPEYKLIADVSFCISNTVNVIEYYHNSSFLEHGGSPERAVRTAFVYAVDKKLKAAGKYNKNESKITFADIEDCLVLVTNSFSTQTSYENQTKKSITNSFIAQALTDFMKEQLEIYFAENPVDTDKFISQVLVNKRSRETAETTRLNIKKKLTASTDVASRVEKFVPCRSKDPEKRELYIVEGDSAMTSCKLGRDADFQAIIPVRGKTLNCQKSTYEKIFKSDIIVDLLRVIGCGVEIKAKVKGDFLPFDINSLRWSKIIICTDADEDGFQIRTLLLTLFNRLLPTLIKEGRVFIAESPLFEITTKDNTYFAYNEQEKAEILEKIGNTKYVLQRSKGLGENEPEMMWKTTMNPASRRLIRVTAADAAETERIFDVLLGDNLSERKEFIARFAAQYAAQADV
ncbi:MAG: DNA topoisomerase [Ruminococcaceae bacterium]|nr:DNA topoisomerase [Oscillospiraceae bacterium]